MAGVLHTIFIPAASYLFQVNATNPELRSQNQAGVFHHLVMQLFYLCKKVGFVIHTAVAFLTTGVTKPDKDDWKKLSSIIQYLRGNKEMPLTLEANPDVVLQWWFAVHPDMHSHTSAVLSFGKGGVFSMSTRQKLNNKSSTDYRRIRI